MPNINHRFGILTDLNSCLGCEFPMVQIGRKTIQVSNHPNESNHLRIYCEFPMVQIGEKNNSSI